MIVDNLDGTFFNSTEWQLLSSLTALATSTSPGKYGEGTVDGQEDH